MSFVGATHKAAPAKENKTMNKKITLKLVGLNGNAFVLLGAFSRQAKKEGWSKEEIDGVLKEAQSGDYNNLLRTLVEYIK